MHAEIRAGIAEPSRRYRIIVRQLFTIRSYNNSDAVINLSAQAGSYQHPAVPSEVFSSTAHSYCPRLHRRARPGSEYGLCAVVLGVKRRLRLVPRSWDRQGLYRGLNQQLEDQFNRRQKTPELKRLTRYSAFPTTIPVLVIALLGLRSVAICVRRSASVLLAYARP